MEWALVKKLPYALLVGTVIPAITALGMRFLEYEGDANEVAKFIETVDIALITTVVTAWTAVLTIAIGCFLVIVMKGPAYVADAYHLHDAEQPYDPGNPDQSDYLLSAKHDAAQSTTGQRDWK